MGESTRDLGLVRAVGPWGLAASSVNVIVGAGIFAVPAALAATIGSYAPLAFVVCAIIIGAIAALTSVSRPSPMAVANVSVAALTSSGLASTATTSNPAARNREVSSPVCMPTSMMRLGRYGNVGAG